MDFRSYFDIPDDITYLNTPGNGLMPRTHYIWRKQRDEAFFDPKGDLRDQQPAFIQAVKQSIAQLFHADANNIYALPNFSFGYNTLLEGLPEGLRFLLVEDEYPSINYPVISRGFSYVTVPSDLDLEDKLLQAVQTQHPDILIISIVNYITGLKVDLNFIQQLKRDYPDLIIIGDATQYLGTEPFDFENSGFDAVGSSGYKWLMSGFGNGFFLFKDSLKSMLYQKAQLGQRPKEKMWENKAILDTFFEPGHQDTLSHGTLMQSMHFLQQHGLAQVQQQIQACTSYAYELFAERELLLPSIQNRPTKSSLINVQLDPNHYPALNDHGVKCFPRGTGIRIGIHLYNNKEDIDTFVHIIDSLT